jgi:[lysine-biosynthesis-protein LysW]--L-2-aminoadipate ligase
MVELCVLHDKVRFEEKSIYYKALEKGLVARMMDARKVSITTESEQNEFALGDVILQRSVSHFRGLYLTACLESLDFLVINGFKVGEICGNKLLTSLCLARNNIPTPRTSFSFSAEAALRVIHSRGFPIVLKPVIGSWGRGVYPLRDKETSNMILETREENDNPLSRIYYLQEMVKRPPRDLRCIVVGNEIVAAIYRYSPDDEWRTNVARGGRAENAPITSELEDITLRAACAIGGGVLGIDLMEDNQRGLDVHEINNTVEFRGASSVSARDIPGAIIDYSVALAKK